MIKTRTSDEVGHSHRWTKVTLGRLKEEKEASMIWHLVMWIAGPVKADDDNDISVGSDRCRIISRPFQFQFQI